ncbi:MAG TPA: hypothetical protein VNB90_09910 [Cytophagaceae bacterium]|nr:hypothetical protein [Cytophagaceae bacterium]
MSKTGKILTGILAFLPLIVFILMIVLFFGLIVAFFSALLPDPSAYVAQSPDAMIGSFVGFFAGIFLLVVLAVFKLIYFLIHILSNQKLSNDEKLLWVIIGIFIGSIGFPVYWYLKIWKDNNV